ncbi:VOC family protein [Streptomyces uncialis]|uniref:VOC family protein n=1 Tax=Streptomyces uncialis TaxID=1048205 RepID=UPI0036565598
MTSEAFTTCLWFDGRAEEAADHYLSVFRNSEPGRVTRYTEAGPGPAGTAITVDFTLNGQHFLALNGGPEFTFNESVSFQIHCADQDEVDYYWDRLTQDGGRPGQCGWLKDRFGVSWQVVPTELPGLLADPDHERAARTTRALFAMTKPDIGALRAAYAGE